MDFLRFSPCRKQHKMENGGFGDCDYQCECLRQPSANPRNRRRENSTNGRRQPLNKRCLSQQVAGAVVGSNLTGALREWESVRDDGHASREFVMIQINRPANRVLL